MLLERKLSLPACLKILHLKYHLLAIRLHIHSFGIQFIKFIRRTVHEFPDRSLLLVITEFTKLEPKNVEDIRDYTWVPKIGAINRPVRHIFLNGTVSTIHSTSGLIKRCNKCKSLILYDANKCPKECGMGYAWDLRISSRLYDGSGAIKMVLTKDLAAKVLQRNLVS